ncbi:MAG: DEAD/DEAH box helicase, partial [Frankiaceae bacterium]|nr:DEAD/DEAH box helicase [Frankiaceae bacterium]
MPRPAARSSRVPRPARDHSASPDHRPGERRRPEPGQAGRRPERGQADRRHSERRGGSRRSGSANLPARKRNALDDLPIEIAATEDLPSFAELGVPEPIVRALSAAGISAPFPIQAATIPDALAGRDVLGRAATGSGKTLAFGLPMLTALSRADRVARRPRALVLLPTRELAMQVCDALSPLARGRDLAVRLVAGGLPINKQIDALARGVDILVATPGRLIDLLERGAVALDAVGITAIDEADHMADLGFLPVVRRLLDLTRPGSQRLLFSATLDGDVAVLVRDYLHDPAAHALAPAEAAVNTMTHHVFRVQREDRVEVLAQIAARDERTIVFVRTKHGADRLARQLSQVGVPTAALHSGRNQAQRTRALEAFRAGDTRALVATDVAARGIHVDDVSLVVHADPPADGKDYLHRSGRTARAGSAGTVVTLVGPGDEQSVSRLLRESAVDAVFSDAVPGAEVLARVTGAREPSGIPVRLAAPAAPARAARSAARVGPSGAARRAGAPSGSRLGRPKSSSALSLTAMDRAAGDHPAGPGADRGHR